MLSFATLDYLKELREMLIKTTDKEKREKENKEQQRKAFIEGALWWSRYTAVYTWDGQEITEEEAKRRYKE